MNHDNQTTVHETHETAMSPGRDDELTITLSRREWVKICAALVMRTDVDRKAQPLIEKLHPIVIEPLIEADVEAGGSKS